MGESEGGMEQETCRSQGDLYPRGRCDRCPALSAESVYDHVLAWGQWDGLCSERFELAGTRHRCLFHGVSAGRCGVGAVLVWRGAVWTQVRVPEALPMDEPWVRP